MGASRARLIDTTRKRSLAAMAIEGRSGPSMTTNRSCAAKTVEPCVHRVVERIAVVFKNSQWHLCVVSVSALQHWLGKNGLQRTYYC